MQLETLPLRWAMHRYLVLGTTILEQEGSDPVPERLVPGNYSKKCPQVEGYVQHLSAELPQAGPQTCAWMKPSTRTQASRHARSCAANRRSKNEWGALS